MSEEAGVGRVITRLWGGVMRRELKTVAKRALRKRADFDIDKIADEVYEAASDWIRSHFGDEEVDYLYVGATNSNMIEVRDELSYDENGMLIHDALNPIVQSYDPTSYFDFYAATVLQAVLCDEEARKETWYVKHDVNAIDGEYDLVWDGDLDAHPYVVKEFDGAWHVGILGFDDKIYFGDTGRDDTFESWDDAMNSIPSSDIYEFVRVGSHDRSNVKKEALMRKRAWTAPYDLDGFDMGKFVEEFDPVGTKVEPWDDYDGYSVLLEDRAHPGFEAWFDVAFDRYGNWECDWNQYILSANDSDNRFRKMFQYYYDESVYSPQFEKAEEAALDRIAETYGLPNPRGAMKKRAADGQIDLYRAGYSDFMRLKSGSAWTWEGMNTDSGNLSAIVNWFDEQGCPLVKNEFWYILGSDMNSWCSLTGDNAYPDDLNILCIELDNITNLELLFAKKFEVGARWLDDVVDNNERRENEKRCSGFANRSKKGKMMERNMKYNARKMRRKAAWGDIELLWYRREVEEELRNRVAEDYPDANVSDDDIDDASDFVNDYLMDAFYAAIQEFVETQWDRWEGEDE